MTTYLVRDPLDGDTKPCPRCSNQLVFSSRHPLLSLGSARHRTAEPNAIRFQRAWVCRNGGCHYREILGEGAEAPDPIATRRRRRTDSDSARSEPDAGPVMPARMQWLPTHDDIARRAHELWEQRGRGHGRDWEDWFRAERELRGRPIRVRYVFL